MDVSSNLQKEKPQIVCVIGGPGCGKGTQCEKLVRDLKFKHLSIGDLMRAEVQKKTKEGLEIEPYQKEGKLVPTSLTINILLKALKSGSDKRYLIDGFPRTLEQALYFENNFREIDFILNYVVKDETMESRILARAAESKEKRADDNPEAVKKRLATFHEQTGKAITFYKQFGKVRDINGDQDQDKVYKETRDALLPNLIFFYGPPASGQNHVAENLSALTGYKYLELHSFYHDHKISDATDEVKMDELVRYLDQNQERNFIINHFPENIKQTRIFCDNYAAPKVFYYFDATKDTVETNIYHESKKLRLKKLEEYEAYTKNRKEILGYFRNKPYFVTIGSNEGVDKMWTQVRENISPEIIIAPQVVNDKFTDKYIHQLKTERGYEYINVPALIKDESTRGTDIARDLSLAQEHHDHINEQKLKLLRKVIFKDILRKKFILAGYPETIQQYNYFEKNCCKISFGLAFTHSGPIQHQNESLLSTLNAKGKLIKIDNEFLQTFDQYLHTRGNWGFILGPIPDYNLNVSKYLRNKTDCKVIDWTNLETELKALPMFANPEDGSQPEEITFKMYCKYFKGYLNTLDKDKNILFDTWPTAEAKADFNFAEFIKEVGPPTYVIYATANKDLELKKLRETAGTPEGEELPEETVANLTAQFNQVEEQFEIFRKLKSQGHLIRLHKIEGWVATPDLARHLNSFIYRKVLIFRSDEQILKDLQLKTFITNYCLANNITFVDVPEIIHDHLNRKSPFLQELQTQIAMRQGEYPAHHPSIYTPDLVIRLSQDFLYSQPHSKYVLIFGYPASDSLNNDYFPRPLDEIYNLEAKIGPVRYIVNLRRQAEDYEINDPLEPKVVKEVPKTKNPDEEGEGGEGQEPPQDNPPADAAAGDDDENKKKFDPTIYEWTTSNGVPKTTTQIYHKSYKGKINDQNVTKDYKQHIDASIRDAISSFEKGDEANIYLELLVG